MTKDIELRKLLLETWIDEFDLNKGRTFHNQDKCDRCIRVKNRINKLEALQK